MISYAEDFRFLNKSMLNNELVVFVGAGVSMGSGLPSWNKLVEEIQARLGISDSSFSDNTIIPQLYYNSRGKKDYNELIRSLLYKPYTLPNNVHECLVKINPRYIITTNYDELIEQAFSDAGIFLDVIEKDSDLPYAHTDHMLIKMHGGFKYDNYVLKEDDYLYYSNNFTLISTYIKALFARYTILFIGYSYNDPDTKQLFSWVRSILKEDQQRAYLINTDDDYDAQTADYYKNMGINVIYAQNHLGDKYNPDNLTQDTVLMLNDIIVPEYNVLSEIDNTFKEYNAFNYISSDYIQSVFNQYFTCYLDGNCLTFHCLDETDYSNARQYFDDSDKEKHSQIQSNYPHIGYILSKSSIKEIRFIKTYDISNNTNQQIYVIPEHKHQDSIVPFEEFDYISIKSITLPNLSDIEDNYLQKAYCHFYLKEYTACYDLLRKAAKYYLSTNQLEMYLITENNRINVGKIMSSNPFIGIAASQREKVKQELTKIQNYSLYANSYSSINKNSPVSELIDFRYIYKNLYRIIENGKKVDEEARTQYSMHTGKNAYEKIEYTAHDLYNYMQYNYLLLDVYTETKCIYTAFIDYLLLSLSTKEDNNAEGIFGFSYNIVLENLSRFDLVVIFRFLTFKEIKNLTEKYKIDRITLDEEAVTYLFNVISNLNESFKHKYLPYNDYFVFSKVFHILKLLQLTKEQFSLVYKTIIMLLEHFNNSIDYSEIVSFISKQYYERNNSFTSDELEHLIITICNVVSLNDNNINSSKYIQLLKVLTAMIKHIAPNKVITISDKEKVLFLTFLSADALISIYSVSDKSLKKEIKERLREMLKQNNNIRTYYNAVIHNIIKPSKRFENALFLAANNNYINNDEYTIYCANLLLAKKIIDREKFIKVIKRDKSLSMVIDPANYDYTDFEPKLLISLTDVSLRIISSNEKAYNCIHIELKKYLSANYDEKLIKIYINYFSK